MKSIIELIKKAIEHEVKASAFYDKAAEMTQDDEARMVFLELVDIEDGHCNDLIQMFAESGPMSEFDIKGYYENLMDSVETHIANKELKTIKNGGLHDVLRMAVKFEQTAVDTYTRL